MEELQKQVEDVSEKALSLIKETEALIGVFPPKIRFGFKEKIRELHKAEHIKFSYQPPFQEAIWKAVFYVATGPPFSVSLKLRNGNVDAEFPGGCPIILSSHLYRALSDERNRWTGILSFIDGAIDAIKNEVTRIYELWVKEVDPEIVGLARELRESWQEVDELKEKHGKVSREYNDLQFVVKKGYAELRTSISDLMNTKSCVGKSKTIERIRKKIEKTANELGKSVGIEEGPKEKPLDLNDIGS